jgi:protein subunit release factor A
MIIKVPRYVANKLDGLRKKDFRIQTFKGSGPGGQHRNKVETAVRITHKATGISAESTDSKSQSQNRSNAFLKLSKKLIQHYTKEHYEEARYRVPPETIRTYNEIRNAVKDHRTGVEANYQSVIDGDIDCFIEAIN